MPQCPPGSDLVLLSASVAIGLSNDLSADDTAVLSGVFSAIGDNLSIIAAKKQICENKSDAAAAQSSSQASTSSEA
ncbi:conserved exported hypothetical protein [uncultured Eubacteriales bacterium]|uniref:Uncharacterized protein n=1 Tax=uncultured Eubacteriales bacterium TaxID=172733 RepID=A0A212JJD1_9FIRM|nr:conserved exported hypothetical protein [uncultured Eubacteriales bacterium]